MSRALSFFLTLFFVFAGLGLFAQEEGDSDLPEIGTEWVEIVSEPYSQGDSNFVINLGIVIPAYFSGVENNDHGISVGGTGSLAYNYFLTSNFFLGGELAGMFASTRRKNMLYMVPFGVRAGFQFWLGRFEFPVSLMIGAVSQKYIEKDYFGLIIKPGVSLFWRFNPDWSFGLNGNWWIVPQRPKNENNVIGNFVELTLSARYHF